MSSARACSTEHEVTVGTPAQIPYRIVADVTAWPHLFPPTVHAERVAGDDAEEQIRLWALANGGVRTWTSRRRLDPGTRTIRFDQEITSPPVASMSGCWTMLPQTDGNTLLRLGHTFTATGDDPRDLAWIREATDKNSTEELAAIKTLAEQHAQLNDLIFSFADSVVIEGPAQQAYDFIYRCQDWPDRLPHVDRVELTEPEDGIQRMDMDTRAPDGDVHNTVSFRICFPHRKIAYKQVVVPPVMTAHTGQWLFTRRAGETEITSRHTVALNQRGIHDLFGPAVTLVEARKRIQSALSTNSLTTLRHLKEHVETRH
jgi:aromatase